MTVTPEKLAATNKANVEALLALAHTAFAGAERLAALNLNTARTLLEDSFASTKAVLAVKNVEELAALQLSLVKPAVEKAVAYSRSVYDIGAEAGEQFGQLTGARVEALNREFAAAFDLAVKSAPAGSEPAVAALKSAMAAANSAFDTVTRAAKQVVEITDANVSAATDAAVKAVGAVTAVPKAKKVA